VPRRSTRIIRPAGRKGKKPPAERILANDSTVSPIVAGLLFLLPLFLPRPDGRPFADASRVRESRNCSRRFRKVRSRGFPFAGRTPAKSRRRGWPIFPSSRSLLGNNDRNRTKPIYRSRCNRQVATSDDAHRCSDAHLCALSLSLSLDSKMINRFEKWVNTEGGSCKSIVIVDLISAG